MTHAQSNDPGPHSHFTPLHVVFDIKLRDSTGQVKVHKIKERNAQKGKKKIRKIRKGSKWAACHCGCKTRVLYPHILTSSHPRTKTLMLMLPTPAGGAQRGRLITRWGRWSCCISGCSSWGSLSTAPALARSGVGPASHTWVGRERLRWLPWGGSTAGRFHLEEERTISCEVIKCSKSASIEYLSGLYVIHGWLRILCKRFVKWIKLIWMYLL